ncbi:COP9 signalosome complex subunit 8 isoform X2 [Poecilia latipinna]|uniref:COP9 signalosome complex subunit 8 isoform X2 n=1 Tax=Poecilia latipinna TaxID=48699 RepID=UPI00072E0D86|nr:PREDICTED: COP9 signalosome complex subunit 8 isoform X2 [Poecilia latipinna]
MPAAVIMEENFDQLLDQCEAQELEAPGGITTPQVYAQMLALYLLNNDMNNARYLWKRIPQAIKSANPELAAIWAVGQRIWQRDFPGIYTAIAAHQWSENILPVMEVLRGVVSQGWQADPATRMVMPKKPDPPPVSVVPNEQQLARLTDYVAFLEN